MWRIEAAQARQDLAMGPETCRIVTAMDTARLETFSDGVFAIAITLLILDVRVPSGPDSLTHRLLHTWPEYLAYAISFLVIGIMWANHHAIFRLIERTSHSLVVANLFLLLLVAFIPFPTAVVGRSPSIAPRSQSSARI